MKKLKLKTLPVAEAIHARVKASATKCGEKQYIHTGKLLTVALQKQASAK